MLPPNLEKSYFDEHVDSLFQLDTGDGVVEVKLVEVRALGAGLPDQRAPFSLIFEAQPSGEPLPQRTYPLTHEKLGALELFLVPIGPGEGATRYEAIFN